MRDYRLLAHYLAYLGIGCLIGSLSLFAPTIVLGLGFEGLRAQLFTVPPYAAAFVCTIAAAFFSDRYKSRGPVVAISLLVCFVTFLVLGELQIVQEGCVWYLVMLTALIPSRSSRRTLYSQIYPVDHQYLWCIRWTPEHQRLDW